MSAKQSQELYSQDGIDEELYSRQLYVLGHEAMRKMQNASVLLIGADGLAQEIAKNIILAGVKSVAVYDETNVTIEDLGAGFYFKVGDVGKNKVDSIIGSLQNINSYVKVYKESGILSEAVKKHNIIVPINMSNEADLQINELCRKTGAKFIMAKTRGFFLQLFVDFNRHVCTDKTGIAASTGLITHIMQLEKNQIHVSLADGTKHSLEENDTIKIIKNNASEFYARIIGFKKRDEIVAYTETPFVNEDGAFYEFEQMKTSTEIMHESLKATMTIPSKIVKHEYTYEDDLHSLFLNQNTKVKDAELKEEFIQSEGTLLAPMCSVLGGFAAQEAIKAASGKFMPLNQYFYLHVQGLYNKTSAAVEPSRYHDYVKLMGTERFKKLMNLNLFLVGAGAIGCENIKNFVMSGIGATGCIHVTDMDSIEKSNLNRQFLFKADDVGSVKSESACRRALEMNADYANSLKAYTTPVKKETENLFSDSFYEKLDVVSNALDNVAARNYIDERCVQHCVGLVDAGTLGTKGHVQVVVPNVTESYGSSTDPEETSIPLCTIRSYPNSIEHTIEWALAEFKTEFSETKENGVIDSEISLIKLTEYALSLFDLHFNRSIAKLLTTFPPDHQTAEGLPFWLPPKKIPHPIKFDPSDELHMQFILSTVQIYCEANDFPFHMEAVRNIAADAVLVSYDHENRQIIKTKPVEFEKDSYHAYFIYAAANLRARNYEIKEQTKHFITGVAGKIIPAIATTTAVVSGLSALEIMKYALGIKDVKNSFLDLAHPMFACADPIECDKQRYEKNGNTVEFTMWSQISVKDKKLSDIMAELSEHYGDKVSDVSSGSHILYMDIMPKLKGNLDKTVEEIIGRVNGQKYAWINATTEDEEDKEIVRVEFKERN